MKRLFLIFFILSSVCYGFKLETSIRGRNFISGFEGCRLKAYQCPAKVWTIGYGNTSHAKPGKTITKEIALQYLMEDLRRFEKHVNKNAGRELRWYEFDPLVSFTFNCGYRFTGELRTAVNLQQTIRVKAKLMQYVHAGKKVLPGLVRRRSAECKYYDGLYFTNY